MNKGIILGVANNYLFAFCTNDMKFLLCIVLLECFLVVIIYS